MPGASTPIEEQASWRVALGAVLCAIFGVFGLAFSIAVATSLQGAGLAARFAMSVFLAGCGLGFFLGCWHCVSELRLRKRYPGAEPRPRDATTRTQRALGYVVLVIMSPVWLAIALAMVFLWPVALVAETWDMIRMRNQTVATVLSVDVETGSKGTSRPAIVYNYEVGGVAYKFDRYLPGFFGNMGKWTGGSAGARDLQPGQAVWIHYAAGEPQRACLEYGWFKWSIGGMLFTWGIFLCIGASFLTIHLGRVAELLLSALSQSMIASGFGILAFAPNVVRPAEFQWYVLAIVALYLAVLAYVYKRQPEEPQSTQPPKSIV